MAKSAEELINRIREKTLAAALGLRKYEEKHSVNSLMLDQAHMDLEDMMVDFERLVNSLPMEARS